MGRAVSRAKRGEGPSTIEATITRYYGHFEGDPQNYRAKDEVARLRETMDCLKRFRARNEADHSMPRPRSMQSMPRPWRSSTVRSPRPKAAARRSKPICTPTSTFSTDFNQRSPLMPQLTMRDALNQALHQEMERDERVIVLGEDVSGGAGGTSGQREASGGIFGVTKGLLPRFGEGRVIDTPISESAIVGAAAGAALAGLRPVAELMFADFVGVCMDQIYNQIAKFRYMFGGKQHLPGRDSHGHGRRHEHGAAAFADDLFPADRGPRTQGGRSLECPRRERVVNSGHPRR
jgi:hypothetical protein